MNLYNIKRGAHGFAIGKFDEDLNFLIAYDTDTKYCSCPAGPRPSCKHRKMLPRMLAKVDTDEFYCYETQTWHRPLAVPDLTEGEIEAGIMTNIGLTRDQVIDKLEAAGRQAVVEDKDIITPETVPDLAVPPVVRVAQAPTIRRR